MKNRIVKLIAGTAVAGLVLTGCTGSNDTAKKREQEQKATTATGPTLEQTNLDAKRKLEDNPNAIGYVYLMSFGKVFGYYVSKGKISSNGSQMGPMDELVRYCQKGDCYVGPVDSKQDDGSYGSPDPGIFFFTTDGAKIVWGSDEYIHSTQPIATTALAGVPKLG